MSAFMGSPWPEEHPRTRPVIPIAEDQDADVAIVGGGISGMATAYHLLATTGLRVTVLDAGMVGNGASGNNGGQAVDGSESGFREIEAMAGRERTVQGFRELAAAREVLKRMLREVNSPSMLTEVTGRLGLADQAAIERWTGDIDARREAGIDLGRMHVAEDAPMGLLRGAPRTPRAMMARQLWSKDRRYVAMLEMKVGLINTCDLVETLATYLLEHYPDRAVILERSPVDLIRLNEEDSAVRSNGHIVLADSVIMCTNGYPMPRIESCSPPILGKAIRGVVGYMVGSESGSGAEGARAYFPEEDSYYYIARRRYRGGWLTAAGGPEGQIAGPYDPGTVYHPGAYERLEAFLSSTIYGYTAPSCRRWQGLMGYTRTGMRVVGTDPGLPCLNYNMGCNGIGILSALAGARRLAAIMGDEDVEPSVFDPEVLSGKASLKITGCGSGQAHRP